MHHLAEPIEASLAAQGMAELYHSIENPLVRVLAKMEHVGVGVDARRCATSTPGSPPRSSARRRTARRRRPDDLNLNSPIQLRELLFDEQQLSPMGVKKTKTGFSTDAQTLEKLQRRVARVHRAAAASPRGREAARHLRRGPARRGRGRRSHPRHVQPDRRPHRPAQLRQAEPAQHPGAQRRGPRVPQGVRAVARAHAARRRLQPDRAALHRPPRRRSRA